MGLFKREPIYLTCWLIAVLAAAEGWVAWHYLRGSQPEGRGDRVAALRLELRARQAEIDHLIFMRDSEHRLAQAAAARARSGGYVPNPGRATSDEEDLAQATVQALAAPMLRDPRREQAAARQPAVPSYPVMSGALVPRDEEDDVLPSPQGAAPRAGTEDTAELTPADIDPKHLVNMANIMTGHPVAELTRMKGQSLIRYKSTNLHEDDPVWHMLDAVSQAHALREIVLVGKDESDTKRLNKLSDTLVSSGIPSRLIRVRAGDADYQGLDGILISFSKSEAGSARLRNEGRNP